MELELCGVIQVATMTVDGQSSMIHCDTNLAYLPSVRSSLKLELPKYFRGWLVVWHRPTLLHMATEVTTTIVVDTNGFHPVFC